MSSSLKFVQGDTLPQIFVSLTDELTGLPVNLSTATSVVMQVWTPTGTQVDTLTGVPVAGILNDDYSVSTPSAYTTPGTGGRVVFTLNSGTFASSGQYLGQIVITFAAGQVQTVWEFVRFDVRPQP